MKRKTLLLLLLLALGAPWAAWGHGDNVIIGTGTSTQYYAPINLYYKTYLTQQIYTSSEIGTGRARIETISFQYGYTSSTTTPSFTLYLGNTTKSTFSSTTDWISLDDMTEVWSGTVSTGSTSGGWVTITLASSFIYTGNNLVVCCYDNTVDDYPGSSYKFRYTSTSSNYRTLYAQSDSSAPTTSSTGSRTYNRPNLRITTAPKTTLTLNTTTGGTVSGAGTCDPTYWYQITATPSSGYRFLYWKENNLVVNSNASTSINMGTNHTLTAFFEPIYTVNASASPSSGGTVALGTYTYNFDDHTMQGWTNIDADGNHISWDLGSNGLTGNGALGTNCGRNSSADCMVSGSFTIFGANQVDNFLVSPKVQLGGSISFYARNANSDYPEKIAVAVSTHGNTDPTDFTTIISSVVTLSENSWTQYTVSLSDYSGAGYVAIRNYDTYDQFYLLVDDITIVPGSGTSVSGTFTSGQSCTATATANSGNTFVNWTENNSQVSASTSYSTTVSANRNLVANFSAPIDVVVGTNEGTTNGSYLPVHFYYNNSLTQQIYKPSEIGYTGNIKQLSFYYSDGTSETRTIAIYMKMTTANTLSAFDSNPGTLVYSGSYTFSGTGWQNIPLSGNGFNYNDICENLMITVDMNGTYSSSRYFATYNTGENRALYKYDDSTNFDPTSPPSSPSTSQYNNYIKLVMENTTEYKILTAKSNDINLGSFSMNPTGINCSNNNNYAFTTGTSVTLVAQGTNGTFLNWILDGQVVSTNASYTVTMNENHSIVANFRAPSYQITASANPNAAGNVKFLVGDGGTTTNSYLPCYTFYNYNLTQQIYTPLEIGNVGTINSIAFYNGGETKTLTDLEFYMVHTFKDEFGNNSDWIPVTSSNLVFSGSNVEMTAGQWTIINLTTPFVYDGVSNLAIVTREHMDYSSGLGCRVFTPASGGNCSIYAYNDNNAYDVTNPSQYSGTRLTVKNQILVNPGGSLTRSFPEGATVTLVEELTNSDYHFENWTDNSSNAGNNEIYTISNIAAAHTVVANFAPSTHTLTASVNPANSGTISDGNNNISGATTYNHGTSVTLTATPNTGYDFIGWMVDGSSVGITNPTVTMDQDHSVVANFELQSFTISASANPSAGGSVSGAGTYNYNTSCTLSTTVNNGYTFTGWFENNTRVSTNTSYTFTVTAARTLEARFTQDTYIVNVSASPAAGGTVSGGGTFTYGAPCTITATAIPGYSFSHWTDNGTQVSGASSTYQFAVTSAHNFVAIFTHDQYNITYTNDGNGSCSGVTTAYYGDNVTVTVTPNAGYELNTLTYNDGTSHTITVSGNQGSFTMPLHAVTVNATFNKINYSISYNNVGNGTVTGPASALYGTTVTVTLTEGTGYHLTAITATTNGTSVTLSGSGNTRTFTMPAGNVSVTATFDIIQYTVNIATLGNGNAHIEVGGTTVSGSSTTVNHGTSVSVTATPASGYSLVNWTNDLNATTVSSNPYQFTADETIFGSANSITLTANFDLTPPSFTTTVNSVTDNSVNMSGAVTYGGSITEYGFCWNTTGETPTTLVSGSYYRVGNGTPSGSFTQNITGFTSNTLYYVWSYVVSNSTVMCGDMQTFTTLAQVTTANATNVTTYDATMGGSWATGGGATITGCGVVYGTGNTPTIGDGTSTQVAMASPSSPFTLQNSSNLQAETTYYVRAYVTNAGGTSYGSAVSFTTLGYYGIAYMVSPAASDGVITFSPAGDGQGQGTKVIPVGTGTNASQMFPFMGTTSTSFDEMLYPALTIDGNAVQGDIQSISFFVKTKATGAQNPTLSIYLMETSSTTLTSGVPVPVANLCYSGTVSVSNLNTWVDITLDTPFAYQGGNLIVAVDYSGSGAYTWASSDATGKSLCFMRSVPSGGNINGEDPAWTEDQMGLSSNQLPNAKFTIATASGNTEWCSYGYTTTASASTNNPDYVFDHWTVDGTDVSGNTPTYTFSTITANHTITANFVLTYKRFINDGNWNVAGNWDPVGVPTLSDEIAIEANAIIPNGVIGYANNIRPITHANSSITIQDGGQLVHNNGSNNMVTVTVENDIDGYTAAEANTNKGYEIVSFPVDNLTAGNSAITGVFTGLQHPFDFYRFDASVDPLEWVHMASNSAISLLDGFIYASQDGTTITVTGPVMSSASNYSSSDVTFLDNDAPRFNGWALLGNPFVCNAYVSLGTNNGAGAEANFYKLYNNTDYDEFIPFSSGDAVTPMGGVMFRVYDDDNIVYSRTAPSGAKTGILNVDVRKTTSRGTTTIDRARVRFGEGRNLEKFQFDTRHTKIYIPEGDQDFSVYYADGAGTIPVNFKAQDNGRYTLDFSTEEVGFNYLHLIDNMNGNDVDLLQTPYYAFDAKSTDFASRFLLVFATGNDNDDTFAFFNNGVWIINNDGEATLQVVDALGRMLSSENISGSTSKAINVAPGVYMLRLINGDKVKVQKIVVKR